MKGRVLLRTTIQKELTKYLIYLLTNLVRHGFDESENETTTIKMSLPLTHIDEFSDSLFVFLFLPRDMLSKCFTGEMVQTITARFKQGLIINLGVRSGENLMKLGTEVMNANGVFLMS